MTKDEWVMKMLIDEMFLISGYPDVTYEDILNKEKWYLDYTMTPEQNEQWKQAGVKILRRVKKWTKKRAEREMDWCSFMYGLKLTDIK